MGVNEKQDASGKLAKACRLRALHTAALRGCTRASFWDCDQIRLDGREQQLLQLLSATHVYINVNVTQPSEAIGIFVQAMCKQI